MARVDEGSFARDRERTDHARDYLRSVLGHAQDHALPSLPVLGHARDLAGSRKPRAGNARGLPSHCVLGVP